MLPARHRLRRRTDFAATTRSALRAGGDAVVIHLLPATQADVTYPVRVGFVVSKAVGGSVERHLVVRRLRAITVPLIPQLPAGSRVVIRALAPAAHATSAQLDADLQGALARVLRKFERMSASESSVSADDV